MDLKGKRFSNKFVVLMLTSFYEFQVVLLHEIYHQIYKKFKETMF